MPCVTVRKATIRSMQILHGLACGRGSRGSNSGCLGEDLADRPVIAILLSVSTLTLRTPCLMPRNLFAGRRTSLHLAAVLVDDVLSPAEQSCYRA